MGLGNHGNHEARRGEDYSTRGKEANERECKRARWDRHSLGMVLELGKLPEGEEKRGRFFNEKERKKERGISDFCGISRGSKCSGLELDDAVHRTESGGQRDNGSVIKESTP